LLVDAIAFGVVELVPVVRVNGKAICLGSSALANASQRFRYRPFSQKAITFLLPTTSATK
jgi:hypothetical protein